MAAQSRAHTAGLTPGPSRLKAAAPPQRVVSAARLCSVPLAAVAIPCIPPSPSRSRGCLGCPAGMRRNYSLAAQPPPRGCVGPLTGGWDAPYIHVIPPLPLRRQGAEPRESPPAAFAYLPPHYDLAKANVYVDGFNLYAGTLYKTKGCKWLNLRLLAEHLFPDLDIQTIKYFTAEISANPSDPGASGRQRAYWRALQTDPTWSSSKASSSVTTRRNHLRIHYCEATA